MNPSAKRSQRRRGRALSRAWPPGRRPATGPPHRSRSDPTQSHGPLAAPERGTPEPGPASLGRSPPLPSPAPPGVPDRGGLLFGGTHYSHGVTEDYDPAQSAATNEGRIEPDILRIPVGPGAVHVERYGHGGTPIVLLHGFGTCGFLWRTVAAGMAEARHTAIAARSARLRRVRPARSTTDFGIAAQAEYVERALAALRIPRAQSWPASIWGAPSPCDSRRRMPSGCRI